MSDKDTRERLEADIAEWARRRLIGGDFMDTVLDWLDRQAAITERECRDYENELRKQHHKRIYELQAKVDELTEERDELLEQVEKYAEEAANFEQQLADVERTHIKLPVDADGVPIKPGDYMALGDSRGEVIALTYTPGNSLPWEMQLDDGEWFSYSTQFARHVQPDTVESLLKEFAMATDYAGDWNNPDDEGERQQQVDALAAVYAERIRAAVDHG